MSESASRAYAERYFREALTLRICLEYNEQDYLFARSGGRIIYIVDANVVRFFIDPEQESDHVVAFRSKGQSDLDYIGQDDYAQATALITAEFLFSRGLSGQHGAPVLIAPSHGEEIEEFANRLISQARVGSAPIRQPLAEEKVKQLQKLTDQVTARNISHRDAVNELRKLVPETARLLISSDWSKSTQLLRLYDEDRLRSLSLHPRTTYDVLHPDPERCTDWAKRLQNERRNRTSPQRAHRDARALVQTMLLDEEAATDQEGPKVRYVLVTADGEFFDIYARWFWGQPRAETERFLLRLPLQYAPILNSLEMPNGLTTSTGTAAAREALDSLFGNLKRADPAYLTKLPFYRDLATDSEAAESMSSIFGENPLTLSDENLIQFRDIRRLWHECFKTGVVLNTNLLERRQGAFRFLAECLRSNVDLRTAVFDAHLRNLQGIQDAHAYFNLQQQIASFPNEAPASGEGTTTPAMFADAMLPSLLGGESLRATLERLGSHAERVLESISQDQPDFGLMFLAAALAYRCERWEVAALAAQRALALSRPNDPSEEAALVLAAATRFELNKDRGVEFKLDRLDLALSHAERAERRFAASGDQFGALRAAFELNALLLTALAWREAHGEVTTPATPADVARASRRALDLLAQVPSTAVPPTFINLIDTLKAGLNGNIVRAAAIDLLTTSIDISPDTGLDEASVYRALEELLGPIEGVAGEVDILAARTRLRAHSLEDLDAALSARELPKGQDDWTLSDHMLSALRNRVSASTITTMT